MYDYKNRNRHGGHFHNFAHYERFADYDTNSISYYDYLAKINKYLHYIDHLLCELQDIINDILERLTDLEDKVNVLEMYMHVPAKLELRKDTMHLLKVDNVNRTHSDGLNEKLEDVNKQLHLIDVSELENKIKWLEKEIENIWKEINEIWKYLDNLTNPKYKTMDPKNYDVVYRNGYNGDFRIRYVDMGSYYTLILTTAGPNKLNNPNLKNTEFKHSQDVKDRPKSVIFQIKFKNEFAHLNNREYLSTSGGNYVWNVEGSSQPLSWSVECDVYIKYNDFNNSSWNGYPITVCASSISDGYNTQYSSAPWYSNANPLVGTWLNTSTSVNVKVK